MPKSSKKEQTRLTKFFGGRNCSNSNSNSNNGNPVDDDANGTTTKTTRPQRRRLDDKATLVTEFTAPHWKRQRSTRMMMIHSAPNQTKSRFGTCPLCQSSLPWFKLQGHAAECTGAQQRILVPPSKNSSSSTFALTSSSSTPKQDANDEDRRSRRASVISPENDSCHNHRQTTTTTTTTHVTSRSDTDPKDPRQEPPVLLPAETPITVHPLLVLQQREKHASLSLQSSSSLQEQPQQQEYPPGLYFYPDFISVEEEHELLQFLDDQTSLPAWKMGRFNGQHSGKRWGVHCNLRDRRVDAPEHPLPSWFQYMIVPKLHQLDCWWKRAKNPKQKGGGREGRANLFTPNEANAIDYRRQRGDWLQAHVDDRKLSIEPIANLSLAGDCYMTFGNTKLPKAAAAAATSATIGKKDSILHHKQEYKVHLPRRGLQILTGPSRYNYTHAITNADLLSDRRVSITMRESPLTHSSNGSQKQQSSTTTDIHQYHNTTPKIDALFTKQPR